MKICPKCKAEVDDNFFICWNCQYSFTEDRMVESSEFKDICPQCNNKVDAEDELCPNCNFALGIKSSKSALDTSEVERRINCIRCDVPMLFRKNTEINGGFSLGSRDIFSEIFSSKDTYDLYYCPKCGKIEFFIPLDKLEENN